MDEVGPLLGNEESKLREKRGTGNVHVLVMAGVMVRYWQTVDEEVHLEFFGLFGIEDMKLMLSLATPGSQW